MVMKHLAWNGAILIIASCLALMFIVPATPAAGNDDRERMNALVSGPDINITSDSLANRTIPDRYQKGPEPLNVQIELKETAFPAPKGEMELGPRKIGFSINPVYLAIILIAVCAVGTGAWFIMKKKHR